MRFVRLVPLAILTALTRHASADSLYVAVEASHSKDSLQRDQFDAALGSAGATAPVSNASGSSNQFRLQGSYEFSPNWAAELRDIDFGKSRYAATFNGGSAQGTRKAGGLGAIGLLLPLGTGITLFGKTVDVLANVKSSLSGPSARP